MRQRAFGRHFCVSLLCYLRKPRRCKHMINFIAIGLNWIGKVSIFWFVYWLIVLLCLFYCTVFVLCGLSWTPIWWNGYPYGSVGRYRYTSKRWTWWVLVVSTHQHQRYATRMTHHHDTTYQNLSISFLFQLLLMDEVKVILKKENILQ